MADDQANTVAASWSVDADNNVTGQYLSPTSFVATAEMNAATLPHVAEPFSTCRISPWYDALRGTLFDPPGGSQIFTDPTPVISSVVANDNHRVTVDYDTTVPSDVASGKAFFFVAVLPGILVRMDAGTGIDFQTPGPHQSAFNIPEGYNFDGLNIFVRIIPDDNLGQEFDSPDALMDGDNFNFVVFFNPGPLPPGPPAPPPQRPSLGAPSTGVNRSEGDFT